MTRYDAVQTIVRKLREAESSMYFYFENPHDTSGPEVFYRDLATEILDSIEEFVGGSNLDD